MIILDSFHGKEIDFYSAIEDGIVLTIVMIPFMFYFSSRRQKRLESLKIKEIESRLEDLKLLSVEIGNNLNNPLAIVRMLLVKLKMDIEDQKFTKTSLEDSFKKIDDSIEKASKIIICLKESELTPCGRARILTKMKKINKGKDTDS